VSDFARRRIERALHAALETDADPAVIAELRAALDELAGDDQEQYRLAGPASYRSPQGGYIERTLEDEAFEPNGREFDIRVHFDWIDYSPGDAVTPPSGGRAVIVDVEVVGVRYFDEHGNAISSAQYHDSAATALARAQWDQLEEACTEQGAKLGAGATSPLFSAATSAALPSGRRMAPSARARGTTRSERKLG
jgi:hypothetical protein